VGRQKVLRVDSFEQLASSYARFSDLDARVLVQEWIDGGEEDLSIFGSYCAEGGEVVAAFTARKRLQYPALAGTGIVVEAVPQPDLYEPSTRLLRAAAFRGISEIEYKRDRRDGRLYLIEINPRHWDQHGLGTKVGVNLSEALYRDSTGQDRRFMTQTAGHRLWIAEAEYARHVARCLTGRAPVRDLRFVLGPSHTWALFDRFDQRPFMSLFGLRPA
jgi:predicted ATP-grasp superfamily ATP-dependent carboligase